MRSIFTLEDKNETIIITDECIYIKEKVILNQELISIIKNMLSKIEEEFKFHAYYQMLERSIEEKEEPNLDKMTLSLNEELVLYNDADNEIKTFFLQTKEEISHILRGYL